MQLLMGKIRQLSLGVKIPMVIFITICLLLGSSFYLLIQRQYRIDLQSKIDDIKHSSALIQQSTRYSMLQGDMDAVEEIIMNTAEITTIQAVSLLSADFDVVTSSDPHLSKKLLKNEYLQEVKSNHKQTIDQSAFRNGIITCYNPILLDEDCMDCHDDSPVGDLYGVLTTSISTSDILKRHSTNTWVLSSAAWVLVFLSTGLLYLVTKIIVVNPLKNMAASADIIAGGNLEEEIKITSEDETGQLGNSLQIMVKNIKEQVDILDKVPTPVLTIDKNYNVEFMNPAGAAIGGLTQEQCVGKKCYDIFKTDHCNTDKCAVRQAMREDAIVTENALANPNPSTFIPIQYTGAPLKNEKGEIIGALEYIADISDIDAMMKETDHVVETVAKVMRAAANKDLTQQIAEEFTENFAELKKNVNKTLQVLDVAMGQVGSAVEQVSSASNQIASGSQSLAEGTNEQSSTLEEVSSSLEEMSSMTQQNAQNAAQATVLSGEASTAANSGNESMKTMIGAIDKIKLSADETAKIVKTIDEIAFQTNLLALNAAVEAARAGDAGKGFAVVAEEVRNLAQRSAEAAKNTAELINESVQNAEGGVKISQEVGSQLTTIVESIGKTTNLVSEIDAASKEQAQGIEQVNTAVAEMNKVTQQNAANSEESASASEELNSQAEELNAMIREFTLSNIQHQPAANAPRQKKAARLGSNNFAQNSGVSNMATVN